jgi:hypothetical protein
VSERGGELSAIFENGERDLRDHIHGWRATSWSGNDKQITLKGEAYLERSNATVHIEVDYEIVSGNAVRKKMRLRQSDMFMLYCQLTN